MSSTSKNTIVHVIDSLGVGGAERLLETTVIILPEYRHVVCYLSPPHDLAKSIKAERVYFLDFNSNKDLLKCAFKLRSIIKMEKPVLVHSHLIKSTWVSRFACWKKCPLIFTVHNFLSEDAFKVNRLSYYFERATYNKKQTLITVSNAALNDYKDWIKVNGRSYILYNIINERFFKAGEKYNLKDNANCRLVAVGNLRRQKNFINLVKAFQYLKNTNITLDIYGKGEDFKQLESLIKEHNLPILLKGLASNIPEILPGYDGFIISSNFEGFGIAPVEAMAVGLPVLLSDLEVFREVTDGQAIFFDPQSPRNISRAINDFIQLPFEEKITLSEYGKKKAKMISSLGSYKSGLTAIYKEVCAVPKPL